MIPNRDQAKYSLIHVCLFGLGTWEGIQQTIYFLRIEHYSVYILINKTQKRKGKNIMQLIYLVVTQDNGR